MERRESDTTLSLNHRQGLEIKFERIINILLKSYILE